MNFELDYRNYKGKNIRIVILDSGIDTNSRLIEGIDFESGIGIYENKGQIKIDTNFNDTIGHGTAVATLIHKEVPYATLIPIKILFSQFPNSIEVLLSALQYVEENIECNIINISSGICCCPNLDKLSMQCERLRKKGIVIVSSFDNSDLITYPAALSSVIGVDSSENIKSQQFVSLKNSDINYIFHSSSKRVQWLNDDKKLVYGNSFIAPHITSMIAKILEASPNLKFDEIILKLDSYADKIINLKPDFFNVHSYNFKIKKAITFPFNKEIHSLARFHKLLPFEIIDFYDTRYSGNIGHSLYELQHIVGNSKLIQPIENIDWNTEFDTIILGHVSQLSNLTKFNWKDFLLSKALQFNKNIYSFFKLELKKLDQRFYFPFIDSISPNPYRKFYSIATPVIGILGTGSKQGKYTLQLLLRKEFLKLNINIGQLGTEPSALLFGMDAVYPMGYEDGLEVRGIESVYAINQLMHYIDCQKKDLILFGGQSHCLFNELGDEYKYTILNHDLIIGAQPDAFILCVNYYDSINYVKRTISYLESLFNSPVLAIAVSSFSSKKNITGIIHMDNISEKEVRNFSVFLQRETKLPVYLIEDERAPSHMAKIILSYFNFL